MNVHTRNRISMSTFDSMGVLLKDFLQFFELLRIRNVILANIPGIFGISEGNWILKGRIFPFFFRWCEKILRIRNVIFENIKYTQWCMLKFYFLLRLKCSVFLR